MLSAPRVPGSPEAGPPAEVVLEAEGLVKSFGGLRAVDGLSYRVRRGECFGLLGPNGAGKTTTIRMTYGYSPITAGSLRVFGWDVATFRREVAARVGVCQQDNNLDPDLTVEENLAVFARYFDLPRDRAARRADELLRFMALDHRRTARVIELSGGMMRRLVLARALINEPELLILDEPTTGLDPQARHQVWEKVEELRDRGLTVLLTTHYMEEAARLCDRLVILDHGRILVEGTPSQLIRDHVGRYVIEVAEPGDALRAYLATQGLAVEDLGHRLFVYGEDGDAVFHRIAEEHCTGGCVMRMATLEDVFLKLTGRGLRE
ncbi:MAG: ATP-binding cassette domain-containing protein [Deferrisomatales bacterium]|nr:ATP-binding cassette domain-containing protein [Deferrisomatales bacterium]